MLDHFNREIYYLRISVTDRCNLRCSYCMPEEGIKLMSHDEILSYEEIAEIVEVGASKIGLKKIRLTGGEPLVRKGISDLVYMIKNVRGIEEITMTTNGILLPKYAKELKAAGLDRVNISLDTLDAEKFRKITRIGDINEVLKGINAAREAGLKPIKINVVKDSETNHEDLKNVKDFCEKEGLNMRIINKMNLKNGEFWQVEGGESGNCQTCNRLRLMANGDIKPCLFSNETFNIREHGIENAFLMAMKQKPEKGKINNQNYFYNIGG